MLRLAWMVLAALLFAPVASAHGDAASWEGTWSLAPGESVEVERGIHWHRVVGALQADEDVTLLVGGEVVAGPGRDVVVDHLVQCCEAVWTDHHFTVRNVGDEPAEVRVELAFLHDNLAVLAHDAEPGGWWQSLVIVLALVGVPAWRARQGPVSDGRDWLRTSRVLHGAAWSVAGLLASVGMVRFATGPLVGSLAATAPVPSGLGGFFNTHSLLMLALMALWGAAYATWAGARRRSDHPLRYDGYAFAAGPLAVGALMLVEFGGGWIPVVLGLVPASAVLTDLWLRPPERAPSGSPPA